MYHRIITILIFIIAVNFTYSSAVLLGEEEAAAPPPPKENPGKLSFGGNVKFNMISSTETQDGKKLRGIHNAAGTYVPYNNYDVEMNFKMKYKTDSTWAQTRLQYYNSAGITGSKKSCKQDPQGLFGSSICNDLCLRDAFMGIHLLEDCPNYQFDVVIGRKRLYQEFESRIEFNERMDGLLFTIGRNMKPDWEIYNKTAFFIVDQKSNHYAYATEFGSYDLLETKCDLKLSYIDWKSWLSHDTNRCNTVDPLGSKFRVLQAYLAYNINPQLTWCTRAKFYSAFLVNLAAEPVKNIRTASGAQRFPEVASNTKQNIGWYIGFIMGDEAMDKVGDFAIDMNYQYVQAQAVSDFDARGIGRGNILKESFTADGRGKTNCHGYLFEATWVVAKAVSLDLTYQQSWQIDRQIGGPHTYSKLELDFIYQF